MGVAQAWTMEKEDKDVNIFGILSVFVVFLRYITQGHLASMAPTVQGEERFISPHFYTKALAS